jgi:hypothetical protein
MINSFKDRKELATFVALAAVKKLKSLEEENKELRYLIKKVSKRFDNNV